MITLASSGKSRDATAISTSQPDSIDVEGMWARTDVVLSMQLDTTTREDMDASVPAVVDHLSSLVNLDLGQAEDSTVQGLVRKGRHLIEHSERPTPETPAFGVFIYLRDTATIARRLLWIYAEREGLLPHAG
ncbi:hypothetical protein [Streptomyces sp. NPDC091040]|uniref:hypothetical protein n=1 Tax=Streptomyces sp. NPDC091040 TaxID=3365972 RepID=UPI00381313DF